MVVGVLFLAIPLIAFLLAVVSLAVAGAVLARAPLHRGARAGVAVLALVLGFAPLVVLIVAALNWPAGD